MMTTEEETRDAAARREADAGATTTRMFGRRGEEAVRTRDSLGGVRVMLPLDAVSRDGRRLRARETAERRVRALRACGARGVMCDVWW